MTATTDLRRVTIGSWRDLDPARLPEQLERLERRVNDLEPTIHALVPEPGRFERLREGLGSVSTGPLAGVPIGVKDIFHVGGLDTRAGSRLPVAELRGPEATAVQALRRAGCLILGKTVTTEFAYFAAGPTRNPHDPSHTPGGSSSGSAAAVAAGYCPIALGTQTIGSISRPASFCGVVGFKPTFGRISTAGVIPLSPSLDHVGTFTSRVADALRVAALLCQKWQPDQVRNRPVLAIPEGPLLERASGEGQLHFRATCDLLASAGFEIVAVRTFDNLQAIEERHRVILAAEAARVHAAWYPRFRELYDPRTSELIEAGLRVSPASLEAARPGRQELRNELSRLMERHGVDLWLSPAAPGPAPAGLESTGDPVMSLPWTHAGLPTLSLPAGPAASRLPMGLQIAAGWGRDEALLEWGARLEAMTSTSA